MTDCCACMDPRCKNCNPAMWDHPLNKEHRGTSERLSAWMPISSAPRDGRTFLVRFKRQDGCVIIAWYNNIHNHFTRQGGDALFLHDGDEWAEVPE